MATRTYRVTYIAEAHATAVVRAASLDEAREKAEALISRQPGRWQVSGDWDLWTEVVKDSDGDWAPVHDEDDA